MNNTEKEFLKFQSSKEITYLFKYFLTLLEDLRQEHDGHMSKLLDAMPDEYKSLVILANYFDDARFRHYRKRVLDSGNNHMENIKQQIDAL
jgi:hypothetical protein